MKHVVSVSLGSSTRDARARISLLGQDILLERMGTDGDWRKAKEILRDLDGRVDALGLGGADFALRMGEAAYPFHSVSSLSSQVRATPLVDGSRLRLLIEQGAAALLEREIGATIQPKRVLLMAGTSRWGLSSGFHKARYRTLFGDLIFGLGLPVPLYHRRTARRVAALLMPFVGRLPFGYLYPGEETRPMLGTRFPKGFKWARVIAGDCRQIKRFMPRSLEGKVVVTNSTTRADCETFAKRGVRFLITTTPVLEGRSFGTNAMEAVLVAAVGQGNCGRSKLRSALKEVQWSPVFRRLGSSSVS